MSPLKLPKLPDRETTKLSFVASADLKRQLDAYAALYAKEYGKKEALADLIPYMLEAFLASDREFQKLLREDDRAKSPSRKADDVRSL
ncbi:MULTISPECIES: DUF2274 domain-containing protein [unclassified Roseitalea]|uniref:DUF2274 domain-containing protein n=1 Tax=unclassified Roseitalea TaxID=2639107 RepID=UPI0027401AD4|nr:MULTISPECIES: DUF2274 domain-containing protein [unclassified Roseitalea]